MDPSLVKCGFRFVWRIENFSMCPQEKGECIISSSFVVDELDKTMWYIELYPKGVMNSDGDGLSCFLNRANSLEQESETLNVFYDIKLIKMNAKFCLISAYKHPAMKLSGHGFKTMITLQNLSENKDLFLPNDVLTLMCFMWRGAEQPFENSIEKCDIPISLVNNTYSLEEISTLISDVENSTEQRHDTCIFTTRIPVERREIRWILKDFKTQMQTAKKMYVSVATKMGPQSSLLLRCSLSGDWDMDGVIRIDIHRKDKHFLPMLLKCKVSVLDKKGTTRHSLEDQHIFGESYEVWPFPLLLKVETIKNRESEILNDGALTLLCELLVSFCGMEYAITDYLHLNTISDDLLRDVRGMSDDERFADVTLVSEGRQFPVHKFIICARSSVFTAMFTNDTEEKRTGVVHISDIDAWTLGKMKDFMYGSDLPDDLQPEQARKLYLAADKYEVFTLREWCVTSLKHTLSVSNVCEVLFLADLHEDQDLLKYVHGFLAVHLLDVLESAEWTNLMQTNIRLAANTMMKLLLTLTKTLSRCSS